MGQEYNAEYKADVLKLADESGVSEACQRLGIYAKTIYMSMRDMELNGSAAI